MKNLLMGLAVDYGVEEIKKFVLSFRKYNVESDVVLFVSCSLSGDLENFLELHRIKPAVYDSFRCADTRFNNVRFLKYLEFLLDDDKYQNVFISDVRDVVFQADPFLNLPEDFLYLFLEDPGMNIGRCQYNSYWMNSTYSRDIFNTLKENTIICAGTIFGTKNKVVELLFKIRQELFDLKSRDYEVYKNVNVDQAILNKLFYIDQLPGAALQNNGSIVGTLGLSLTVNSALDIITINDNILLVNGISPAVIHQYDRHQSLVDFFENIY